MQDVNVYSTTLYSYIFYLLRCFRSSMFVVRERSFAESLFKLLNERTVINQQLHLRCVYRVCVHCVAPLLHQSPGLRVSDDFA